jgi:predicted nucleotidyltransferase
MQLLHELKKHKIRVKYLILYGSYYNGTPNKNSDIDLAIISPDFQSENIVKKQEMLGNAIFNIKEPIEILGYSLKEYKQQNIAFLSEIKNNGKIIYSNPQL